jgi:putative transposase
MREKLHLQGEVKQVTIKLRAGKWFASFLVECDLPKREVNATREPSVGVDLGLSTFATLSNGSKFPNPRPMKRRLRLLKRRQRQLSHKKKQSNRRAIARLRVSKIHKKVSDYRKEFHHEVVNYLVENFDRVVIEDLAVSNMVKNKRLARSISDVGWSNFRNILTYKCLANEVELVVADRYFASSKTCSCCGHKVESLELSTRVFECSRCEHKQDRDLNASINLCNYEVVTPSLTVRERSKTYILDQSKTFSHEKAGLFEGVNSVVEVNKN